MAAMYANLPQPMEERSCTLPHHLQILIWNLIVVFADTGGDIYLWV